MYLDRIYLSDILMLYLTNICRFHFFSLYPSPESAINTISLYNVCFQVRCFNKHFFLYLQFKTVMSCGFPHTHDHSLLQSFLFFNQLHSLIIHRLMNGYSMVLFCIYGLIYQFLISYNSISDPMQLTVLFAVVRRSSIYHSNGNSYAKPLPILRYFRFTKATVLRSTVMQRLNGTYLYQTRIIFDTYLLKRIETLLLCS